MRYNRSSGGMRRAPTTGPSRINPVDLQRLLAESRRADGAINLDILLGSCREERLDVGKVLRNLARRPTAAA
jgi:hypothetical protein